MKLQAAKANYTGIQTVYASTENQQAELSNLQKQFEEKEKKFQEYQQQCFSSTQASQFFENINAAAIAYNLKPLSRIISEPKKIGDSEINDGNAPPPQFLKTQSAKIAVCGNYFDIIDFVNELVDRPQKIGITNLHIALPVGEEFSPKASFEIILVIDSSKDTKK
ncbi:MAG: type 4a pilus biogenesis protein PilO [Phycisphaerae bacterium]|nr:type 4a pilus biogenesis protein PilO [Phycisphaerae bacterium]